MEKYGKGPTQTITHSNGKKLPEMGRNGQKQTKMEKKRTKPYRKGQKPTKKERNGRQHTEVFLGRGQQDNASILLDKCI